MALKIGLKAVVLAYETELSEADCMLLSPLVYTIHPIAVSSVSV